MSKTAAAPKAGFFQCSPARPGVTTLPWLKNGDGTCTDPGPCFGMCGPGCTNPGDISTPACYGHDLCVCAYGFLDCVLTVPEGCDGCSSLFDAVCSYIAKLIEWFFPEMDPDEEAAEQEYWMGQEDF